MIGFKILGLFLITCQIVVSQPLTANNTEPIVTTSQLSTANKTESNVTSSPPPTHACIGGSLEYYIDNFPIDGSINFKARKTTFDVDVMLYITYIYHN